MNATATAMPQDLASQTWSSLLRLFAAIAVLAVLAIGSFALGRTTADESGAKASVVPAASPAPSASAASCARTVHMPPC
jgi:hypothetical protein